MLNHIAQDTDIVGGGLIGEDADFAMQDAAAAPEVGAGAFTGERRILHAGHIEAARGCLDEEVALAAANL